MNPKYPMTVITGSPGITNRVVYGYRGHRITRSYRTHDVRNKTHNGYWYDVAFADGKGLHGLATQKDAKSAIDRYEETRVEAVA
jgi:predicted secreted protein